MEDHGQVVAFLKEAAELAVKIAHGEITVDQYVETIEKLKADLPADHVAEAEEAKEKPGFFREDGGVGGKVACTLPGRLPS